MGYPHHVLPSTKMTCLEYEQTVLSKIDQEDCQSAQDALVEGIEEIDLLAYCGCDGFRAPSLCAFCHGDPVALSRSTPDDDGSTCADLVLIAPFVKNMDYCEGTIRVLEGYCCGQFSELEADDYEDIASCSLCHGDGPVGNPFQEITFFDGRQTCAEIDQDLHMVPNEACPTIHAEFEKFPIDIQSYCGCEGALPPNTCALCREGAILVNESMEIPDSDMTCASLQEILVHVLDDEFCQAHTALLSNECCGLPQPTEAPRGFNFPKMIAVSAASHEHSQFMVSGLLLVVVGWVSM